MPLATQLTFPRSGPSTRCQQFTIKMRKRIRKRVYPLGSVGRQHLDLPSAIHSDNTPRNETHIMPLQPLFQSIPSRAQEIDITSLTSEFENRLFTLPKPSRG